MGQWLSERSFWEIIILIVVIGCIVEGIILTLKGRD